MPKSAGPLSAKEKAFVDAFMGGPTRGNGTKSVIKAGYTKNAKSAGVMACKLLAKGRVQVAVQRRTAKRELASILSADQIDRYMSAIVQDEDLDTFARIGAAKELNKVGGRHSMTFNHKGKLTLEQALGMSREGESK